ncbi:MAG: hypothetical protein ACMXYK_01885 [Candidatus Woesearchaeota archaeon]
MQNVWNISKGTFQSHEVIAYFIEEKLGSRSLGVLLNRLRKLRNGRNYYGDDVHEETVRSILDLVDRFEQLFRKYDTDFL